MFEKEIGHPAIFNSKRLPITAAIAKINSAVDVRANVRIEHSIFVISGGQKVAIAAPVFSQKPADVRQGLVLVTAAQQQLSRPHGARGQNHATCVFTTGDALAVLNSVKINPV